LGKSPAVIVGTAALASEQITTPLQPSRALPPRWFHSKLAEWRRLESGA